VRTLVAVPALLLVLVLGGLRADAEETAESLEARLAALRRRVIECIDRIEALERKVASLPRPAVPPGEVPPSAPAPEAAPPSRTPPSEEEPEGAFACRYTRKRLSLRGGSRATERAVEEALAWLAAHQASTGAWEAATFSEWCDGKRVSGNAWRPTGAGKPQYDTGVTGLALCAFLGAGHAPNRLTPYANHVSRGLAWLRQVQDAGGCFGPRTTQHYVYNHAFATLAVVEGYGMTGDPRLHEAAQRGLDFIALARNPYFAWRYGVKPGDNDTSVTGCMMLALKSAKLVNDDAVAHGKAPPLQIDEDAFDGIQAWITKMTDPDFGRTGYIQRGGAPARPQELLEAFPGDKSESMTAVGLLARLILGEDPKTSVFLQRGARLCLALPPTWDPDDGSIDMYYWYYGTLAFFQMGGTWWSIWNDRLKAELVRSQRRDGTWCGYKGSWDPLGPWGPDGGRVYATAMCALCLEVYYRYER